MGPPVTCHFNVHDKPAYSDTLGSDFRNVAAARVEAVERIGKLLTEEAARFWTGNEWTMDVTDFSGLTLLRLTFMATDSPATMG